LDKMIPMTAFQPKWVSMYGRSQFQALERGRPSGIEGTRRLRVDAGDVAPLF
jgi:hypothetical protein